MGGRDGLLYVHAYDAFRFCVTEREREREGRPSVRMFMPMMLLLLCVWKRRVYCPECVCVCVRGRDTAFCMFVPMLLVTVSTEEADLLS